MTGMSSTWVKPIPRSGRPAAGPARGSPGSRPGRPASGARSRGAPRRSRWARPARCAAPAAASSRRRPSRRRGPRPPSRCEADSSWYDAVRVGLVHRVAAEARDDVELVAGAGRRRGRTPARGPSCPTGRSGLVPFSQPFQSPMTLTELRVGRPDRERHPGHARSPSARCAPSLPVRPEVRALVEQVQVLLADGRIRRRPSAARDGAHAAPIAPAVTRCLALRAAGVPASWDGRGPRAARPGTLDRVRRARTRQATATPSPGRDYPVIFRCSLRGTGFRDPGPRGLRRKIGNDCRHFRQPPEDGPAFAPMASE